MDNIEVPIGIVRWLVRREIEGLFSPSPLQPHNTDQGLEQMLATIDAMDEPTLRAYAREAARDV